MMISRIDHISLAVKDYEKARDFFETVFGAVPGADAADDAMKYFWKIFSLGDLTRLELMAPTGGGSFLDNFLASKKTGGAHHITLETPDIEKFKAHLEAHNIPYFGYAELGDAWKELFIHPKDAFGILIQVAQMSDPDEYLGETMRHMNVRWHIESTDGGITLVMAHPGGGKMRFDMNHEEVRDLIDDLSRAVNNSKSE